MDEMPTDGFRHRPRWLVGVAAVVFAQAGLALALVGGDRTFAALLDDRPVLSGRHPLHLYHGSLGAEAFRARGTTTAYDPNFQAGYSKTPVFDGGCRPAELVLWLAGRGYSPAAYKFGLFACLLLVPVAFVVAGRGAGLPAGAAVLAGALGVVLGATGPGRRLIEEGEIDYLLAGLGLVVFVPWLARYGRFFGVDAWLVLAATTAAGWYAHPAVWAALVPVVLGYYLVVAPRHGLAWHVGLLGITSAGVAPNAWWLCDWVRFWWLREPSPDDPGPPPCWEAIVGGPNDYVSLVGTVPWGVPVAVLAGAGLILLFRAGHRGVAGLIAATAGFALAAARVLAVWPHWPADVPDRLVPLAAGLLALPAAFAVWTVLVRFRLAGPAAVACVVGVLLLGWADGPTRPLAGIAQVDTRPLLVGLTAEQRALVDAITANTGPDARILWDDTTDHPPGWNWTALLPVLTNRAFIGGLDHRSGVMSGYCVFHDGCLLRDQLPAWTDAGLDRFCWWYNVGWVVCRSPAAAERWAKYPAAKAVARLTENGHPVVLFALDRRRSFVLSGTATWEGATPTRVTLTDVTPDATGHVTLSLHHADGLRAYPSFVGVGRGAEDVAGDPTNHVRLRVPGPVPRLTLVFDAP